MKNELNINLILIKKLGIIEASIIALIQKYQECEDKWIHITSNQIQKELNISRASYRNHTNKLILSGIVEKRYYGKPLIRQTRLNSKILENCLNIE